MLTQQQIHDQRLILYIHIGENKEGTPQFRKVRYPHQVDIEAGKLEMWVEDFHLDVEGEALQPVVVDPENPPKVPAEITVEATLRHFEGHIIAFNPEGKKVNETPVKKED